DFFSLRFLARPNRKQFRQISRKRGDLKITLRLFVPRNELRKGIELGLSRRICHGLNEESSALCRLPRLPDGDGRMWVLNGCVLQRKRLASRHQDISEMETLIQ